MTAPIALLLALSAGSSQSAAAEFFRAQDVTSFSPICRESLDVFLQVEAAYQRKQYARADGALKAFWKRHPAGTDEWARAYRDAWKMGRDTGVNIGCPPCYYALRMLTECVRWRTSGVTAGASVAAQLTVVLVGSSEGTEPTSKADLDGGGGRRAVHVLEPMLLRDKSRVIRQSLWLFEEYVRAATNGALDVKTQVVVLKGLKAPVTAKGSYAGLADGAWAKIWDAVPAAIRESTDWWWVIYPSHVPEQYPDFSRAEFITGGMGSGPDGISPCFIIDDRWLTRKPPHLGKGPYTDIERRAYLPQWLQHEFFHHLLRTYPSFGLEAKGHQWFDRKTWPADFEGRIEPDYYAEALEKRLRKASPPMQVALLYAAPPRALLAKIRVDDVLGTYRHDPVENDWHVGTIRRDGSRLRWTNRAGKSWLLQPDLARGDLRVGPDCPYIASGQKAFHLILSRDASGRFVAKLSGFGFGGGVYRRVGP